MQVSRLRLSGFKSFVDPTELTIAPGLTGVVGPNGCGKSNLLEALRWAMGENRPTAMRGAGMEDVIFAGASTRPPRAYAEVSIILDNADRLAPVGFNDADVLDITRRITRDIGSAFKVNGKDVRARDVQMLFADAATGAHSPALVRQGQIGELINAKPKARRKILEDAAGIGGLYQRRHEAELKLKSAEANLERVDDVIQNLDQQLSSLARQARQARRYREIAEQLRGAEALLLYRRWREAKDALDAAQAELTEATRRVAAATAAATQAGRTREQAADAMAPLREEEAIAGASLHRLTVQREQLEEKERQARGQLAGLERRIQQLGADLEREEGLAADAGGVLERLEAEEAELKAAAATEGERLAEAEGADRAASAVLAERETELDALTERAARVAARRTAAERRAAEAQAARDKIAREIEGARAEIAALDAQIATAEAEATATAEALEQAEAAAEAAERALEAADAARGAAQAAESAARARRSEAEGAAGALKAEAQALERLLASGDSSAKPILDQVRASPGYETALGAALGEDLSAPEAGERSAGWTALPDYADAPTLPDGAEPLSAHVTAPKPLSRRLAQIGVASDADCRNLHATLRPGQRLVTTDGALWRWDGLVVAGGEGRSAAALRLAQRNRLDALRGQLTEAEAAFEQADSEFRSAREAMAEAERADREARQARRDAEKARGDAARGAARAETERDRAEARRDTLSAAAERRAEDLSLAEQELNDAAEALAGAEDPEAARTAVEAQKRAVNEARASTQAARAALDAVRREGDARRTRLNSIARERGDWSTRRDRAGEQLGALRDRIAAAEKDHAAAISKPEEVRAERDKLGLSIAQAEQRRRLASDALANGENALRAAEAEAKTAEQTLSAAREARARAEAVVEGADERVSEAAARIWDEDGCEPDALLETHSLDPDDATNVEAIEAEVAKLRRQRDALGAVNLRAEEDAEELSKERLQLATEKDDLEAAIAKLRSGVGQLNREGRQRLLDAFEEVNTNFSSLFTHLFGGGEARLALVESDDPLEAGLEIMCMPPGKKLSTLSLLSGGEQTLTALALIFSVFLANPSPICVLDEVDAPLDDANVERFCDLLDEMTRRTRTRFLIITHHAITMSRMDRLFGVTMQEKGVSQLVSCDLGAAAAIAAE